jgi:hypothetical protein
MIYNKLYTIYFFLQLKIPSKAAFKLRPRDVIVNLKKKHIYVGIKGQPPILDDELQHEIKLEETTWLLEDGKTFLINIEKVKYLHIIIIYLYRNWCTHIY